MLSVIFFQHSLLIRKYIASDLQGHDMISVEFGVIKLRESETKNNMIFERFNRHTSWSIQILFSSFFYVLLELDWAIFNIDIDWGRRWTIGLNTEWYDREKK